MYHISRSIKAIFIPVMVSIILFSCASNNKNGLALKVSFHDYKKEAVRAFMQDNKGNDYEQMYDVVQMKVLTAGKYYNQ